MKPVGFSIPLGLAECKIMKLIFVWVIILVDFLLAELDVMIFFLEDINQFLGFFSCGLLKEENKNFSVIDIYLSNICLKWSVVNFAITIALPHKLNSRWQCM